VQRQALAAADGAGSFKALLAADPEVGGRLSAEELEACFDPQRLLRHVDVIFERVFE
jgi:adenylosuccinate lyase